MADEATNQNGDGGNGGNGGNGGGAAEVVRPDWAPETVWDTEAKSFKPDALKATFEELGSLKTFKTEIETKQAALPKTADEYKIELPANFEVPKGMEFKVDPKDPLVNGAREIAAKYRIPPEALTELVGLYAGNEASLMKQGNDYLANETKALGEKADARREAVRTWATGLIGKDAASVLEPMLRSKAGVETLEAVIAKMGGVRMEGNPNNSTASKPGDELAADIGKPGTGRKILEAANAVKN